MLPFSFASYSRVAQSLNQKPVYDRETSINFHEHSTSSDTPVNKPRAHKMDDEKPPVKRKKSSGARISPKVMPPERETRQTSEEKRDSFFSLKIGKFSIGLGHAKDKRADRGGFRR